MNVKTMGMVGTLTTGGASNGDAIAPQVLPEAEAQLQRQLSMEAHLPTIELS